LVTPLFELIAIDDARGPNSSPAPLAVRKSLPTRALTASPRTFIILN